MRPRQGYRGWSSMCTAGTSKPPAATAISCKNVCMPRNAPVAVGAPRVTRRGGDVQRVGFLFSQRGPVGRRQGAVNREACAGAVQRHPGLERDARPEARYGGIGTTVGSYVESVVDRQPAATSRHLPWERHQRTVTCDREQEQRDGGPESHVPMLTNLQWRHVAVGARRTGPGSAFLAKIRQRGIPVTASRAIPADRPHASSAVVSSRRASRRAETARRAYTTAPERGVKPPPYVQWRAGSRL